MAHSLPINNTTYRAYAEKLGASDPTKFVGNPGDLFWDPNTGFASFSDGMTPGGIGIRTRSMEALASNRDESQWVSVFGNLGSDWKEYWGSGSAIDSSGNIWVTGGYSGVGHRATLGVFSPSNGELQNNYRFVSSDWQSDRQYGEAIAIHKDSVNGDSIYVMISTVDNIDELILAKLNTQGDLLWTREITGGYNDRGVDVITADDGTVFICGSTNSTGAGGRDGFIARYNPDGTCEWKQTFGGVNWDRNEALAVDKNHLYVVGQTASAGQGGSDIVIAKLTLGSATEQPTVVWQKTIGRPASYSWEFGFGIAVAPSGNIYFTGEAYDPQHNSNHIVYVAKMTSDGALVWQKYLGDYSYSVGTALVLDAAENLYLSGYAYVNYAEIEQTIAPQYDEIIIAKFDTNGNLQYASTLGTRDSEYLYYNYGHRSITADDNGNLYVTGYTYDVGRNNSNGFLAKVRADGQFEGVYGDFISQLIVLDYGDSNLVLADSDLTLQDASAIDSTNPGNVYVGGYGEDNRVSYRSPFEFRIRGALVADTTLTRDFQVNQYPFSNTDGNSVNLCIGEGAGSNHDGASDNIYLGYLSGFRNQYGDYNVYIGDYAGNRSLDSYNTFIGSYAGFNQREGSFNVILGYNIDLDNTYGSSQLAIGSNGYFWIKGDSDRNVKVANPGSSLQLVSPDGNTVRSLNIDNLGDLYFNGVKIN